MTAPISLVLASSSPRRAQLLTQLGLPFRVLPSRVPEELLPGELPELHAERLAREKAMEVWRSNQDALVLAGDTVVVLEGRILGKPADSQEAVSTLMTLSGRTHTVISGLALAFPQGTLRSGITRTDVTFRPFDERMALAYAATGEPMDKAGAYGIQGLGGALVWEIQGDYHNVVGLPIPLFLDLLRDGGLRYEFGRLVPLTKEVAP